MREPTPRTIHLKDYAPPAFLVDRIDLDVDIRDDDALVTAKLALRRNPESKERAAPLVLDGDELELINVVVDGHSLRDNQYTLEPQQLTIPNIPESFILETVSRIQPQHNTALEGLYATRDGFFTQCEAQGFRRITWFTDRPDVMARYTTTIRADREKCPVLLSNGNLVGSGDGEPPIGGTTTPAPGGTTTPAAKAATPPRGGGEQPKRHWAKFDDPYPKPSYLFALVAAKLDALEDRFVTRSGKNAKLYVYVEPGKLDQAGWAMQCLKRAMKWDEEVFGLELDLDQYKIAAVGDFNAGAMENKGLNIFNTKYVLARPDTATDSDFLNIDRVVAHEYFHNWTGNRVTCRDWFQLSLKEGLTVFRDQEYGADTYSRAVTRIQEVRTLRAAQFPEDAGPMAHPVRPQSYMEIRNFYTVTVYEKGAEVVRMQHTLLGKRMFRAGMDLYFERHDGQAVTCDDFVQAMQDASGVDLAQFRRWYDVPGTPVLDCSGSYADGSFMLSVRQSMEPPFHIPLAVKIGDHEQVLSIRQPQQSFSFKVGAKPVPSLLRGFSAPVILNYPYSEADLLHLMARDDDAFNRWEAGQRLAASIILQQNGKPSAAFIDAVRLLLQDRDPAFVAEALVLPSETFLAEQMEVVDPDRLHASRNALRREIGVALRKELLEMHRRMEVPPPYSPDAASAGRRALRNTCLGYLSEIGMASLAHDQFHNADNMTDAMAALGCLANLDCPERPAALEAFHAKWKDEPLVLDKWLAVQASSRLPDTLARVQELLGHPAFDIRNPNKVYALIRSFAANHVRFHAADGAGYRFLAERVLELNALNPQVAARMARSFDRWRKFDAARQAEARAALERVRGAERLSNDVAEIVAKALA